MTTLKDMFGSNMFFYAVLALFGISAAWVASASIYPMAFDEEFHYGLIQIYAQSWLPYGIEHTKDMAQYGSATGDPSYLFHYLMSFPYRLLSAIGIDDTAIIITLRLFNIGFVLAALLVFARALKEAGMRQSVINTTMAFLCAIPVFVMLAAQINYDNLLLIVVASATLLTVRFTNGVIEDRRIRSGSLWMLVSLLLVGMSIKYAFLPIVAAIGIWLIGLVAFHWRRHAVTIPAQLRQFFVDSLRLNKTVKAAILISMFAGLFFATHYVTNTVQYGHPIPDCAAVFDEDACTAYGPWNRNRNYVNGLSDSFQPLSYPAYLIIEWLPGMTERLTFALAGKTNDFQTKQPLPIALIGLVALSVVGLLSLLYRLAKTPKRISPFTWFTLLAISTYVAVLSLQLYGDYVRTGQPVAINGRYLLLLLPVFGAILIDSTTALLRRMSPALKTSMLTIALIALVIGGGGVSTYIIQAESHWFFPGWGQQSHEVLQRVLSAVTIRWQLFP